jgi:RTX calcium-binding nonapeptide repeat (4 copies)
VLADSVYRGRTIPVKANTLAVGDRYHLELRSRMTTNSAQVGPTGSITIRFDNIAMALSDRGPNGASGSAGVRFVKDPLSDRQMRKLIKRTNWSADKGNLAGGSIVARKDCTIIGTPGKDRIVGSRGNDVICGLGGNDRITGQGGIDLVDTGAGADRITASGGGDVVAGLAGRDNLLGNGSGDRLGGGAGRDRLAGGPGKDRINGGSGKDRAVGSGRDRVAKVERRA